MADTPQVLDLSQAPADDDRPTLRLPQGEWLFRFPDELGFEEFGRQMKLGKLIAARAPDIGDDDDALEDCQAMVIEAAKIIVVDLPEDVARKIRPGQFAEMQQFFNGLGGRAASRSERSTSSAPGASGSTETQEAA